MNIIINIKLITDKAYNLEYKNEWSLRGAVGEPRQISGNLEISECSK
jgi:hypothetical protein